MPKYIKENENNLEQKLYIKLMNETYTKELMFDFYLKLFITRNPNPNLNLINAFSKHPLIAKKLMNLSSDYFVMRNKSDAKDSVSSIFYKKFIPLELNPDNYLFLKFYKFHTGFVEFNELYRTKNLEKFEIDENLLRDYITKAFFVCLEKNRRSLKNEIVTLKDEQLISNICVKERLVLFNFMRENSEMPLKSIKDFINRQYMQVLRGKNTLPILNFPSYEIETNIQAYNVKK